ncbi:MAG: hypothetical protein K4445_09985 [Deltaproteobacteria bacterium]|jgi:hypothetical protein|nr:hypothetical protein [Syntrophaceae bacterium]
MTAKIQIVNFFQNRPDRGNIFEMRNHLKGLVNEENGIAHHGRAQQHDIKSFFRRERWIPAQGNVRQAEPVELLQRQPAGLPPRQVLVIGFDERNVQIGLLVGNQGNIGGNGRSLQGMGRDQVALRRLQRLLAIKKI